MSNWTEFHELNMPYCSMHQKYRKGKRERKMKKYKYISTKSMSSSPWRSHKTMLIIIGAVRDFRNLAFKTTVNTAVWSLLSSTWDKFLRSLSQILLPGGSVVPKKSLGSAARQPGFKSLTCCPTWNDHNSTGSSAAIILSSSPNYPDGSGIAEHANKPCCLFRN